MRGAAKLGWPARRGTKTLLGAFITLAVPLCLRELTIRDEAQSSATVANRTTHFETVRMDPPHREKHIRFQTHCENAVALTHCLFKK